MTELERRRRTRLLVMGIAAGLLVLLLAWAFWPRAVPVDIDVVERGPMIVTIDEEARTRVRDAYIVSAPIAGRLMRVEVDPGDPVLAGDSVLAIMLPMPPSIMDVRTREQARANVAAAEAALRVSRADLNSAIADQELAQAEAERQRQLRESGFASQAALDAAERQLRSADAARDTATAAISMRQAELQSARARLIEFSDAAEAIGAAGGDSPSDGVPIPLRSPISGRILRVIQESETTVTAGQPILEIGDISNDLEVIVELISTDAVKIDAGDRVLIDHWGGDRPLEGVVERIEPWGFTKYSALGVEEQRVNTIIRFATPIDQRDALGHGYRVEVRIVVWEREDALIVPSSALFRHNEGWAVFQIVGDRTELMPVTVLENNGTQAALEAGPMPGTQLVLYPASGLQAGMRVKPRG